MVRHQERELTMDDYVLTKIIQGLLIVAVYIVGAVCGVWN